MHPPRNVNLPRLDRIIGRNSGNHKGVIHNYHERERSNIDRRPVNIDMGNLLKIEGKNNNPKYEEPKKAIDRDLKAELRRIYNLKASPSKQDRIKPLRRNIELPRIH